MFVFMKYVNIFNITNNQQILSVKKTLRTLPASGGVCRHNRDLRSFGGVGGVYSEKI